MTSISFLRVHLEEEPDSDVEDRENSPSRFFSTLPDLSEFLASREREERRREVRNRKKGSFGFTSVVRQCTNTCMGCMFSGGWGYNKRMRNARRSHCSYYRAPCECICTCTC